MTLEQKITIKGKERDAIFTLRLLEAADRHNIEIPYPSDSVFSVMKFTATVILAALHAGHDKAQERLSEAEREDMDVTLFDIYDWATPAENRKRFAELTDISIFAITGKTSQELVRDAKERGDTSQDAEEYAKKKIPLKLTGSI